MSPDSNGDLVVIFSGSLRFRHSGKITISSKKGQAETCPYPQKEVKMKSIYTIPRKSIQSTKKRTLI
jgi:hypothetical protein